MLIVQIILLAFLVFVLVLLASYRRARKSGGPFFPTPRRAIRRALQAADLKPGEIFYDLGAGTGRTLLIAEKEFGAKARGFEISIALFWIARINLFLRRAKSMVLFQDLWKSDISDADVVFFFLAERTVPKVEEKMRKELKPGARAISYAFPLPTMQPEKIIPIHDKWNMFVYRKEN